MIYRKITLHEIKSPELDGFIKIQVSPVAIFHHEYQTGVFGL